VKSDNPAGGYFLSLCH